MPTQFGRLGLQVFLTAKNQQQETSQFNQKLAAETRQNSLLNDIRRAQLYQQQRTNDIAQQRVDANYTTVAQGDQFHQLGIAPGRYDNAVLNNLVDAVNKEPTTRYLGYGTVGNNPYAGEKYGYVDKSGKEVIKRFDEYKPTESSTSANERIDARGNVFLKKGNKTVSYLNNDFGEFKLRREILGDKLSTYLNKSEKTSGQKFTPDQIRNELKPPGKVPFTEDEITRLNDYASYYQSRIDAKNKGKELEIILNALINSR